MSRVDTELTMGTSGSHVSCVYGMEEGEVGDPMAFPVVGMAPESLYHSRTHGHQDAILLWIVDMV